MAEDLRPEAAPPATVPSPRRFAWLRGLVLAAVLLLVAAGGAAVVLEFAAWPSLRGRPDCCAFAQIGPAHPHWPHRWLAAWVDDLA